MTSDDSQQTEERPAPAKRGIYLAVRNKDERSRLEDTLVLDRFDVSVFPSATALWESFSIRPTRFVITERQFPDGFTGLDLCRGIRKDFLLPYVYVVMLSTMKRLDEIKQGLAAGVDDYLIKPPNPLQIRSRVLVGKRWLAYIDSLHSARK